jgi:hypothetical protein
MLGGTSRTGFCAAACRDGPAQNTALAARMSTTVVRRPTSTATAAAHHIPDCARARKTVSLLMNPESGGRPEIATAPMMKQADVIGIFRARPPSSEIRLAPVE